MSFDPMQPTMTPAAPPRLDAPVPPNSAPTPGPACIKRDLNAGLLIFPIYKGSLLLNARLMQIQYKINVQTTMTLSPLNGILRVKA